MAEWRGRRYRPSWFACRSCAPHNTCGACAGNMKPAGACKINGLADAAGQAGLPSCFMCETKSFALIHCWLHAFEGGRKGK